jgi:hypothetical protein
MSRRLVVAAAVIACAPLLTCGGDQLLLPGDTRPAELLIMMGNYQTGARGQALAESLVVQVVNSRGHPIEGQDVAFVVQTGEGGRLEPDTVSTDALGRAWTWWTLGTSIGLQTVEVHVIGDEALAVTFTASAASARPAQLVAVSGDQQAAPAGTPLSDPLVVQATDSRGDPVAGLLVSWTANGGGTVSAATGATGTDGRASVERMLGPASGTQTTVASASAASGSPVTFTATATVGRLGQLTIVTQPSGTALIGVVLPQQPRIQLRDPAGNPRALAGVAITASIASGLPATLTGQLTRSTDASGLASFADLALSGPAGGYRLRFSGADLAEVVSSAISLTTGEPSRARSSLDAEPEAATVLIATSRVSVTVRNSAGSLIGGATVMPASNRSGAYFIPISASTGEDGVASFNFTASIAGAHVISAQVQGVEIDQRDTIIVSKLGTSTTITSDIPDPSLALSAIPVNVSVTATAGVTPAGTVSVSDGEVSCITSAPTGSCQLLPRSAGSKSLTANYQGSGTFDPSIGTETHRVDSIPTVTDGLQSNSPIANPGVTIRFVARVTSAVGGLPPPPVGNSVTFARNACAGPSSVPIGEPQPLSSAGWASIQVKLPPGLHVIFACYNGSPSHATSAADPITQLVRARF